MGKIKDALQFKGRPYEIPDVMREDLPEFFKEMGFTKGVEIGTSKGNYAVHYGKAGLELFCVDPYTAYSDYDKEGLQETMNEQLLEATAKLAPYNCHMIRKTSMEALADFEDESLDFVYIDGNHGFKYVTEDIFEWSKKVKKGGVISGHDYIYTDRPFDNIHAKYVLDAYTAAFGINFYVLGRKHVEEGERRNKHRSWFFIK